MLIAGKLPVFKVFGKKTCSLEPKMFGAARRVLAGYLESTQAAGIAQKVYISIS